MKKLLLVFLFIPLISFSQYSRGYSDGWKKGYCYDKTYGCNPPNPPMAPTPNFTKGEDYSYKSGYSRGLLDGRAAGSGRNSSSSKGVDWGKAYEYAPGGAKSQQMTNDAIDRALNNRRSSNRGSSNYNYSSGSRSNAPSIDYSLYNSGIKKYKAKDYEGAKKDFTAYIQKYPNDNDGWKMRGNAKSWLEDWSGACYDWKRAADLGNENAQKNLLAKCNPDGTARIKNALYWFNYGARKNRNGDYQEAIYAYTKAIELLPTESNYNERDAASLYSDRAAIKRESGDPKGAIDDYNQGIALYPNLTTLWGGRGTAKSYLKDMDGACKDWNKATKTGINEEAKKVYQKYIDENCNNYSSQYDNLEKNYRAYLKTGDYTLHSEATFKSEVLHKIKGGVYYRVIKKGLSYTLIETDKGQRGYIQTYSLGN